MFSYKIYEQNNFYEPFVSIVLIYIKFHSADP